MYSVQCKTESDKLPYIRKEVVEKIFEQPYISPRSLLSGDIKSLNTAKKYLSQLEGLGIMTPKLKPVTRNPEQI